MMMISSMFFLMVLVILYGHALSFSVILILLNFIAVILLFHLCNLYYLYQFF